MLPCFVLDTESSEDLLGDFASCSFFTWKFSKPAPTSKYSAGFWKLEDNHLVGVAIGSGHSTSSSSFAMILELQGWVFGMSASFRFLHARMLQIAVIFAADFELRCLFQI